MSIFFEILVRIASYGPQIDQSHGENRLSHIKKSLILFDHVYTHMIGGVTRRRLPHLPGVPM